LIVFAQHSYLFVIIIFKRLKRHSKAERRAPAYSRAYSVERVIYSCLCCLCYIIILSSHPVQLFSFFAYF